MFVDLLDAIESKKCEQHRCGGQMISSVTWENAVLYYPDEAC